MTYSLGWWDFEDGEKPAMVNRYTGERVVREGALPPSLAPDAVAWTVFRYHADDLVYPLVVHWPGDGGRVEIDHPLSALLWCEEAGTGAVAPPFGTFTRVDDIVPDAFWCWPGMLDTYFERRSVLPRVWTVTHDDRANPAFPGVLKTLPAVVSRGGWVNGAWRTDIVSEDVLDLFYSGFDGDVGAIFSSEECEGRSAVPDAWTKQSFTALYDDAVQFRARSVLAATLPSDVTWVTGDGFDEAVTLPKGTLSDAVRMRREMQWALPRPVRRPTPFSVTADGTRYVLPRDVMDYEDALSRWMCSYNIGDRLSPLPAGVLVTRDGFGWARRANPTRRPSVLFEFTYANDGFFERSAPGLKVHGSFEALVTTPEAGSPYVDAEAMLPALNRDFQDAISQWRGICNLTFGCAAGEADQGLECIAHFSKFLGGRAVHSRGRILYLPGTILQGHH